MVVRAESKVRGGKGMKTVKRKANVWERILITEKYAGETRYTNGDIGTVTESNTVGIFANVNAKSFGIYHKEYEVIIENGEAGGMNDDKFAIENLVGREVMAVVTDTGKVYTTYWDFAKAAGYSSAVSYYKSPEGLEGQTVKLLAKGKHGSMPDLTIYVIETSEGEQFLIGAEGLEIKEAGVMEKAAPNVIEKMQAEIDVLKAKVAALEEAKVTPNHVYCRHTITPKKSPQQIRDEIIAKAKADIEDVKEYWEAGEEMRYVKGNYVVNASFSVNKEKRTVVAILRHIHEGVVARGIAKADPSDCFNVHIGKAIALRRALGLEVPAEYYNAPAPTEVRVGDVVKIYDISGKAIEPLTVDAFDEDGWMIFTYGECSTFEPRVGDKIIDDSRE